MKLEIIRAHTKVLITVNSKCVAVCDYSKESILFIEFIENKLKQANEADTAERQSNIPDVSGSCVSCHYSGNGAHGCNRLMNGVTPKIDKSKGVECAHNGYVHYLPFSHDRYTCRCYTKAGE